MVSASTVNGKRKRLEAESRDESARIGNTEKMGQSGFGREERYSVLKNAVKQRRDKV